MSRLAQVKRGKLRLAPRMAFYGPEGVGKTTLAAHSEAPIWLDIESSSGELDVPRYPFADDPKRGHIPERYEQVREAVSDLIVSPHAYKTVVFDTLDALEKLMHRFLVQRDKVKPNKDEKAPGIHSYGYGKGFDVAVDEFRSLILDLDRLRYERDMAVIFLAHSHVKKFTPPDSEGYDRYTMRMNEKAASFIREQCEIVGYCCYEDTTSNMFDDDKIRGVSTGRRLIKFERCAAHDAKSRYAIPSQMELKLPNPWEAFAKAVADAQDMDADQLLAAIAGELDRVGDDILREKVKGHLAAAGKDTTTLQVILGKLRDKPTKKEEAQTNE